MIDFKNTLINLHKKFPEYDLDKLIEIIDAIVETIDYNKFNYPSGIKKSILDEDPLSKFRYESDNKNSISTSGICTYGPNKCCNIIK